MNSSTTWSSTGLRRVALIAAVTGALLAACGTDSADLIRSAREYQAKGDHAAAIIQLKNAVQQQPANGEARLLLGQSSLAVGDPVSAEKEFRRALEYGQSRATVTPLLAQALLESGQPDKVISEFADAKLDEPRAEAELRARVGEAHVRSGKFKEASVSFAAALAADPSNVRAQLGQVGLMAMEGQLDAALAAVAKVIAAHPKSAHAQMLQGELKLAAGDRAGGRASLEQAVAADPALPQPRFALIGLLIADGQLDAAATQVEAARAVRGGDLRLTYFDALIAVGKKDFVKARDLSQQLLKRAPEHVPTLVLIGGIELQEKHYATAESTLQRVLMLAPQHTGARILLVRTYLASNQAPRAVEVIQPLIAGSVRVAPTTMMLAGETYLANGDIKEAAQYFEAASQSKSQQELARIRLGQIALASGDLDEGIKTLEAATAQDNAPIQAQMALIAGYTRKGETAKALQAAQALVKKHPDNVLAYQILGAVQVSRKDASAARAAYAKALELNPLYLPAAAGLARLDLAANKPVDARARFESIAAKDPKNELALLGLADVMAATRAPAPEIAAVLQRAINAKPTSVPARVALITLHLQTNNPRAALSAAQDAVGALGKEPRIQDALGRAQLAAGETNQAIETFNRLAAAEPQSTQPLTRLASVYASRQEPGKAVEALLRAQKLAPSDPAIARDLVLGYLMQGKTDDALKQARNLQSTAPKSAIGFVLEGDVYSASKQWGPAERSYRDGLKADPGSIVVALKLHGVLVAAGKKGEADALARKWIGDHPNDVAFQSYLAEQALRGRDFKLAATQYQAVLAKQPDNVTALNNLAWALGQLGDPNALGYAERALKLAPESPLVLDTVGVLYTSRGDPAKGAEYLTRAVALAPQRHDIRLNYAKALLKAGRTDDARKELEQLQKVSQDFPGKSEVAVLLKQ